MFCFFSIKLQAEADWPMKLINFALACVRAVIFLLYMYLIFDLRVRHLSD